MTTSRQHNWLPLVVIALVVGAIGTTAWWVAASAAPRADRTAAINAEQFAALLGRPSETDQGCINCHTDRAQLTADLENNPVEEVAKSTESEGEG